MTFSFFRSIRTHLLLLVMISVLPAFGIVIYSGIDRLHNDTGDAKNNVQIVLQNLVYNHEFTVESTRQFLMTIAKLPDVQHQNAPACNKLFRALLKENPIYTAIIVANAEGMVFANALPATPYSVKQRKYFQDSLRTKEFSVGEYMIGIASGRALLPFSFPVMDSKGRITAVVTAGIDLDRYSQMFTMAKLPKGSVLGIFDHKNTFLYRSDDPGKYIGKADSHEMITHMSAQPEKGIFTAVGGDGIKRIYAYKRFYLKNSSLPYLFMRIGIPEEQALLHARKNLFNNMTLLCSAFIIVMVLSWLFGKFVIVQRLNKLADASLRLGHGDLKARTGLDYTKDELGQVVKTFDEMADKLELKELESNIAEEALRKSENYYRAIFENSGTALAFTEEDMTISMVNKEFEKLTGFNKAEVEGRKKWTEFVANGEDLDQMKKYYYQRRTDPSSVPQTYEFQLRDHEGKLKDIVITVATMPGMKQNLAALLDLSERKQAEKERARLVTVIEQAAEGIVVTDTDWIILYANPAFERMTGYNKSEIIGQRTRILKGDRDDKAYHKKNVRETISHGNVWSGRLTNKRKDGSIFETDFTASPVRDKSGAIINYVTIQRDITHEVRLENQLRQAQKMEAIGTLAGGIAHDFNNILMAIIGYSEMALYKVPEGSPAQHDLEQVLKAGSRARDLVKQILTFSRHTEQEKKPLQVVQIVKEALKLIRSSLPTTIDIHQENKIPPKGGVILADPTQIHQVLMNLCTNAAHAMRDKGGLLSVELSETEVDDYILSPYPDLRPGPYIRLTVSDTGHGMDTEVLERIFDPYFTTKAPGEGNGMGLAVVQGIVKSYGGAITVYSEYGAGTAFHVLLPRIIEGMPQNVETLEALPLGNERILFVDDEESLVNLGKEMLESLGYNVMTETDSRKALEMFNADPGAFDLIITDMTMPGMTGIALAKELMVTRSDIPIILCTGFSEMIDGKRARGIGIRQFVLKPFSIQDIAKTIRKVLDKQGIDI